MTKQKARTLFACPAAALTAVLGATTALAATTWTIKPGGAVTASAGVANFKDTGTQSTFACEPETFSGTFKSGSGLTGTGAGSISAASFQHCSGPLGENITLKPVALPWHVNLSAVRLGVVTGSITHMRIRFTFPSCAAVIDGTGATASDGSVRFRYDDSTGRLKVLMTGGNLHFYDVSGCAGLVRTGDPLTVSVNYLLSPEQAITSP